MEPCFRFSSLSEFFSGDGKRNETEKTENFQKIKIKKLQNLETKRNGKPQEMKRNVTILFRNKKNET
jgi:hypothetical protein